MKRIKSFLTIIMATIFALSLVPAGALAANDNQHGEMYYDGTPYDTTSGASLGSITIINTRANETYKVYRIFDLASFSDSNTSAGKHDGSLAFDNNNDTYTGEAYSYVIRQYTTDTVADHNEAHQNPWWTFLFLSGATGTDGQTYAALKNSTNYVASADYENAAEGQLFWVEPEAITLTDASGTSHDDYHVVTATKRFSNTWDVAAAYSALDTTQHGTFPYSTTDYVEPNPDNNNTTNENSITVVQTFAQNALAYAQKQVNSADRITANYIEKVSASNTTITVNSTENTGGSDQGTFPSTSTSLLKKGGGKVPLGWYLVGTTMGTLASLDTTNKDVTIYNKNQVPSLEKKVLRKGATAPNDSLGIGDINKLVHKTLKSWQDSATENDGKGYGEAPADSIDWVDNTDADVNDLVLFRSVITARQGVRDYRLHDVMEKGLEFYNDATLPTGYVTDENGTSASYKLRVFLVRGADTTDNTDDDGVWEIEATGKKEGESTDRTNWTLNTVTTDNCDFEVVFSDATNEKNSVTDDDKDDAVGFVGTDGVTHDVKDGDRIVVLYWAKVLPTAIVYGTENDRIADNVDADKVQTSVWDNETADKADSDRVKLVDDNGNPYTQAYYQTDDNNRNTNSTILTYGARSHTEWAKAEVTTYQLDVVKTQDKASTSPSEYDLLKGAKFRMYKATTDSNKKIDAATDGEFVNAAIPAAGIDVKKWDATASSGAGAFVTAKVYQEGKAMLFDTVSSFQTTPFDNNNTSDDANDDTEAVTVSSYRYKGDKATGDQTTTTTDKTAANVLESTYNHEISVHGLEEGWYILVEEEAPEGFNKLAHPIVIYINGDMDSEHRLDYNGSDDTANKDEGKLNVNTTSNNASLAGSDGTAYVAWNGKVSANPKGRSGSPESENNPYTYTTASNGGVHIVNQTGAELPSTGGMGTTIFYVAGTVLVVGAVVMLVAKRRMGAES